MSRRIVVEHIYPPIPVREFDWCATFADYEPGEPQGYGATKQAAIDDLMIKAEEQTEEGNHSAGAAEMQAATPAPAESPIDPDEGLCWLVELWAHENWQPTTSTGYYYEGPEWNDMTRDPLRAKRFKTEVDAKLQAGMLIPPSHYQPAQWRATQHEFVGATPATPAQEAS